MAVLTKVDKACPVTEKNLKDVYSSKHVKKKVSFGPIQSSGSLTIRITILALCNTQMEEFSASTGIPMNCTFPVKNYSEETELDDNLNALILNALRLMVQFGDDFIEEI